MAVTAIQLLVPGVASAAAAWDMRPDLRMLEPREIRVCAPPLGPLKCPAPPAYGAGSRWLRFDAIIVNEGKGPFIVRATRPSPNAPRMRTRQVIRRTDGSRRVVRSDAIEEYATDDSHHHWHVQRVEHYQLYPLGGPLAGEPPVGHKVGFCFFDGVEWRPKMRGAAPRPVFSFWDCGTSASQALRVGLSVGWGDIYPWDFGGQYIDITAVPDGDYLLCLTADPMGHFLETRDRDNDSWARITLSSDPASPLTVTEVGRTSCNGQLGGPRSTSA
jgi:hypothetical protein